MITLVVWAGGVVILLLVLLLMQSMKPESPNRVSQPTVTVGMDPDEWLDMVLEDLDEKDRK